MSFRIIRVIAQNEMKTLLRSWFFRIFVLLAIVGLGFFNVAMNITGTGAPWIYRALACSIPYANLIILNLGQAVVAIFLASEFLKQDRKNDTIEVIYAHSMSNTEYITGKTLGILSVFFILNLIVLSIGIGFSFLGDSQSRNILTFLAYPFLISLPTLVFVLGLSFFFMVLLKNQAITFILLLGYIALSVFYLNQKAYHLFDYIAYQVPMAYSPMGGFGNLSEIILHRSIYFLAGLGFIFFTVYKLERLPQSRYFKALPLVIAFLFFLASGGLMYHYYQKKEGNVLFKQQIITLNDYYSKYPRATLQSCHLNLQHHNDEIEVSAVSQIQNRQDKPIDTLLFSLNPSLMLKSVQIKGEKVKFYRKLHIVRIPYSSGLQPGDSLQVSMDYRGTIDERVCFPDLQDKNNQDNFRLEVFNFRKRVAYVTKNFVCLTRECLWYPETSAGYSSRKPFYHEQDFTRFSLQVQTSAGLMALSQGKMTAQGKGRFGFTAEYPLPQINLLIGPYVKLTQKVDSIEYSACVFKGNESFKKHFNLISDSIKSLIREMKNDYESRTGFSYPFKRFSLVEVPAHFSLDIHEWAIASDAVQPEMVLCPEKGILLHSSDFKSVRYWRERDLKRKNQEIQPREMQMDLFRQFLRENFMAQSNDWYYFRNVVNYNTYSLLPEYVGFTTQIDSKKWPFLDLALQSYLNKRITNEGTSEIMYNNDLSRNQKIILELKKTSLKDLMVLPKDELKEEDFGVKDVLAAKGIQLFSVLKVQAGDQKLDSLLRTAITRHRYQHFPFEDLEKQMLTLLNISPETSIEQWYSKKGLPGFLMADPVLYKVQDGDFLKYQVQVSVSNAGNMDGMISLACGDYYREIFIPARSARRISFVLGKVPVDINMSTYISENLPQSSVHRFSSATDIRKTKPLNSVEEIPLFTNVQNPDDIIVDNEDEGFRFNQNENKAFLKSLISKKTQSKWKYSGFRFWSPPEKWESFLRSNGYGKYVNSAVYTRAGAGERNAVWKALIRNQGFYEVSFYYINQENYYWGGKRKGTDYNLLVHHDGGVDKIVLKSNEMEDGWNSLGVFYFSSGFAEVELSNRSNGTYIIADAVKWTKSK